MNTKVLAGLLALTTALVAAGCVKKVSGGRTAGVPFIKDKIEGRYVRSMDDVFTAAKAVIIDMGILQTEGVVHGDTNQVKTVVGKVNQRTVYVRVQPVDASVTSVTVQTRAPGGGSDIDLAHQIEKQIALKLVQ